MTEGYIREFFRSDLPDFTAREKSITKSFERISASPEELILQLFYRIIVLQVFY
jgi:hypothetical protein